MTLQTYAAEATIKNWWDESLEFWDEMQKVCLNVKIQSL
ncbi:hypothetical protein SAMN05421780_10352 [Flexibacter flexilis DSM 6793]|uniref:Uncharacterized protein n=1 Tax=Flexibacter flexilis DSM 6793 TaxID=927664 RepID=A0A1I1GQK0_9BACT|nr:hypothetical protein SAMN05421780_10352 [Flexibacter flexilis DSM 6793]